MNTKQNGRPANEDQIRLECTFWVPGPGTCSWTGKASQAGWCTHYEEWICPRCGTSDGLRIIDPKLDRKAYACIECGEMAFGRLPCGHPICGDCYKATYQIECATCNGHAAWCRFSTDTPDLTPVEIGVPEPAPDDWLEQAYELRTEVAL